MSFTSSSSTAVPVKWTTGLNKCDVFLVTASFSQMKCSGVCVYVCVCVYTISLCPMAARSQEWVYGLSLAGIAGSICCECSVLSVRGLCVGTITRPEESYRVWCLYLNVTEEPQ